MISNITARTKAAATKFAREDEGGELLEYALIAGLIVIAAIAAINVFSGAAVEQVQQYGQPALSGRHGKRPISTAAGAPAPAAASRREPEVAPR